MSMYLDVIGRYSIGGFTDQTHINIDFVLVFQSLKYRSTNMNESFGEMLTEWGGLSEGRGGLKNLISKGVDKTLFAYTF